ncbi:MAG: hypothetical protein U9O97_04880 [Elusimicrobiota bacterium]|nr:hypothetical protein [Elusimicrobiota bacterium]
MDKEQGIRIIKDVFENPFDYEKYAGFSKNLLKHITPTPTAIQAGSRIPDAFKSHIRLMKRVGKYEDPQGNTIDILAVWLKKGTSLERARTMQRNYIARYLDGSRDGQHKNAALTAFVSPDENDWRFSFIKMEYELGRTPTGRLKGVEKFTPAKRYSFIVGSNESSHTAQSQLFNCKIPFLNGGLFDPINDYNWVHTDILLPNEIFSDSEKTKEGDKGTGILDVFDRYNFTVKEDEPLEKDVAVDPEMLGKVFENLLDSKERKSKGSFYTPREIVHYMCQESLINYLITEFSSVIPSEAESAPRRARNLREDIELLVRKGESIIDNEYAVLAKEHKIDAGAQKGTKIKTKMPKSIRENAKALDNALERIRVCDPAVGSGAFLVGMMNEIVKVRRALAPAFEKVSAGKTKSRIFQKVTSVGRAPFLTNMFI